jgi:phosphate transport system substrate-binding protein
MNDVDPDPSARGLEPPSIRRRAPLLWTLVALALGLLTASIALVLLYAARGPRPPFLSEPSALRGAPASPFARAEPWALELAGSGSNLPLTRALVEAFRAESPGSKVTLHDGIGTTGGIRAVRDGVIHVALASRPLEGDEAGVGLVVTPYARVAVVVAANGSVPDTCTTRGELAAMFAGRRRQWSDGSGVVVLLREREDSSFDVLGALVPELRAASDSAYHERLWRVLFTDLALQEALLETTGSVGIFDLGAIDARRLPLKVLCFEGVEPTAETLLSGRYPFSKGLAFVTPGAPVGLAAEFIRFALSAAGREVTARLGYVPLPLGAPPGEGAAP